MTSSCIGESSRVLVDEALTMRHLIPLAVALRDLAGGYAEALAWVETIRQDGESALARLGLQGDNRLWLRDKAEQACLLSADGCADSVRAAELVIFLDTLSALPPPAPALTRTEPLVFTVPSQAQQLISPTGVFPLFWTPI
jgi:hypothetical protein